MAIRGVEDYLEPFEKAEIFMLVHGSVRRMSFDVTGDNVTTLTIVACGQQTSSPRENIIIEGTSTFDGTRLDNWQVNDDRNLYIGQHGISISINPAESSGWAKAASQPWGGLPSHRFEELRRALPETSGFSSEADWWDKWKGVAAGVLGIVAGTAKMAASLKAAAGGIHIKYVGKFLLTTHTVEVGAAYGKIATVFTAAGPAVLLGAGVAAAVYFIPWKEFFKWLSGLLPVIVQACQSVLEWFSSWFSGFQRWVDDMFPDPLSHQPRRTTFSR